MVGPLTLMKVLHCRKLKVRVSKSSRKVCSKKKVAAGEEISRHLGPSNVNIKIECTNDLCRVCLQHGKIPIFGITSENISENLFTIVGIEVSFDDPYPKKICKPCHALLEGALLLRRNAQQTDKLLKETNIPVSVDNEEFRDMSSDTEELNNLCIQNVNISRKYSSAVTNEEVFLHNVNTIKEEGDFIGSDHKTSNINPEQIVNGENTKDICSNLKCIKCNLQFKSFEEYTNHRLSDEHENKKETCPICNKLFRSNYIKKHIAVHKQEASFICDICGKHFALQPTFNRHRMTHSTDLPFKCSLCPYRGRFSESLKMHMRSHTGERPYQCANCEARFINKSNLIKHMRRHVEHYDYSCEICGKAYYTKRELDQHIRAYHKGIKEHVCSICHKSFGYRKQMMKHELKVHKREKLRAGRMPLYLKLEMNPQEVNPSQATLGT